MALALGMDENGAEHVAIVTTEACTNLLKHAHGGQIILQTSTEESDAAPLLELLAVDQGPGMSNLDQCLRDGYSTGTVPARAWALFSVCRRSPTFIRFPAKARRFWLAGGLRAMVPILRPQPAGRRECFQAW